MKGKVYTIGHSTHSFEKVAELLRQHGVDAVADVRSHPYSRMNPQFSKEALQASLEKAGFAYRYFGRELGARPPPGSDCYDSDGKVQYDKLAQTPQFQEGIEQLIEGMDRYRIALLCAEKEPLTCHRTILVCRHLEARDVATAHILEDGSLETHESAMQRLMGELGISQEQGGLLGDDPLEQAYGKQGRRLAYQRPEASGK